MRKRKEQTTAGQGKQKLSNNAVPTAVETRAIPVLQREHAIVRFYVPHRRNRNLRRLAARDRGTW